MDELIGRIVGKVNIDDGKAREAVKILLSFLYKQGQRDKVSELVEKIPGASSYIDTTEDNSASLLGGLGGMMGGGTMDVLWKLQGLGLGMSQIQGVTQETVNFARETAGDAFVSDVVASIPGLGRFV